MQNSLKIRQMQKRFRVNKILKIESVHNDLSFLAKRYYTDYIENKKSEYLENKQVSIPDKKIYQDYPKLNNNTKFSPNHNKLFNLKIGDKEWKEIWNKKFKKYKNIGKYLPKISDRLFFSFLLERKLNLKSKYTFNDFLSSSKVINYNFINTNEKVDFNSLYKLLKSFFKSLKSIISYPIFKNSPQKLKILLFYYVIPNKNILKAYKNYHNYIRYNEKLFKDTILRTKLIKFMARFKMILFISKWKENNNVIKLPNFNKKASSLYMPLVYKIQDGLNRSNKNINPVINKVTELEWMKDHIQIKSDKHMTKIEQRPIFDLKTVQYNLSKLIPFHKNLVKLLLENDFNLLDNTNKKLNKTMEINKILARNLFKKLSLNKDFEISENLESLNIGLNIEKENILLRLKSTQNYFYNIRKQLINILEINKTNNSLKISSVFKNVQEIILIYSELIFLKEKIQNQEIFNYKKNIVYSLIFCNKLILLLIKLKHFKIGLDNKSALVYFTDKLHNLNFDFEGLEQLNLESLEKFYNTYNNLNINRKDTKNIFNSLKLPTMREVLSLIKEQKTDFLEEPLIMNYSNPYAYKNANLLIIMALYSLHRAMLIPYLNLNYIEKDTLLKLNNIEKDNCNKNLKFNENLKNFRQGGFNFSKLQKANDNDNNLKSLSNIKSNNGSSIVSLNKIKFKYLISFLERIFNKSIELELIRLKYPAHHSNILSQVLGLSSKRLNFFTIMRKLLYTVNIKNPGVLRPNFDIIPSYLSGIKIRLGGRLSTEKLIPRKTVKTYQMGSIARDKINFKDKSKLTLKNKRGAYTFTVITSHIFKTNNKKVKY